MDPLTIGGMFGGGFIAGEASIEAASAVEATVAPMAIIEGAESTGEAYEVLVGEKGLLGQLDAIQYSTLESVAARNDINPTRIIFEFGWSKHPETGVPFREVVFQRPDGTLSVEKLADFDAIVETRLPPDLLQATDYQQSKYCNEELRNFVEHHPQARTAFSETQLYQIGRAETPEGFVWHHHHETGRMQLVDSLTHLKTGHIGGKCIWGGAR